MEDVKNRENIMKPFTLILMIIIVNNLFGSQPSPPQNQLEPSVVDLRVLFQFSAPSAKQVNLAGSFPDNQWLRDGYDTDVMYDDGTNGDRIAGDGIWSIVKTLTNSKYEYRFVVDRKLWFNDPNACSNYIGLYDNIDNRKNSIIIVKLRKDNLSGIGSTTKFQIYDIPAQPLKKVSPIYPDSAKSTNIEGVVIVQVEIFEDGTIGAIEVIKSMLNRSSEFEEAAIKAVRQWKFAPAILNGKPISIWQTYGIEFLLK